MWISSYIKRKSTTDSSQIFAWLTPQTVPVLIYILKKKQNTVYISQLNNGKCKPQIMNIYSVKKSYSESPLTLIVMLAKTWRFLYSSVNHSNIDIQVTTFLHYFHLSHINCSIHLAHILEDDNSCSETENFLQFTFLLFQWQHYRSGKISLSCSLNKCNPFLMELGFRKMVALTLLIKSFLHRNFFSCFRVLFIFYNAFISISVIHPELE